MNPHCTISDCPTTLEIIGKYYPNEYSFSHALHVLRVILMDATVATGAAAMMAIRVLLDHEVPEENIHLVSLLMAESGVHSIAYSFPKVKMVTTAVDPEINDKFHVLPGIGNFGDRYFGTEPILQL